MRVCHCADERAEQRGLAGVGGTGEEKATPLAVLGQLRRERAREVEVVDGEAEQTPSVHGSPAASVKR